MFKNMAALISALLTFQPAAKKKENPCLCDFHCFESPQVTFDLVQFMRNRR